MTVYPAIAAATALGGFCRYLAGLLIVQQAGLAQPFATMFVNISGSFLIGLFFTLTEPGGRLFVSSVTRQMIMTGFLGGYTTFSILSLETLTLVKSGGVQQAVSYVIASLFFSLLAVWFGHIMALSMNRPVR
jgi:fluoride exporter